MLTIELIEDAAHCGSWNMAADEWLMLTAGARRIPMLRIYRWSEPTLSLGYFQPADQRDSHPPSHECPWVRRASGGGAIVHHHEITYALAVPTDSPRGFAQPLYDAVHQALVDQLIASGLQAQRYSPSAERGVRAAADAPFLCFARRAPGDVLLDGEKILGSAQRRSPHAVVQHGSLLWRRSPFAPELPGLVDLTAHQPLDESLLLEGWLDRLAHRLHGRFVARSLADSESQAIDYAARQKFAQERWNRRR